MPPAADANTLASPAVADLYRALTRLDPGQRHVRVCGLTVAGRPVAGQRAVEAGGRFTNLLTSCAGGDRRRFSPSLLRFCDLFGWCFAHGLGAFDFGMGDEPCKDRWRDRPIPPLSRPARQASRAGSPACASGTRGGRPRARRRR